MTHVTDERTDRPLDTTLHDWLGDTLEELPDGSELPSSIRIGILSRLPSTPQRRRWWPLRWFPFGIGATRSADTNGPRSEGRSKSMFTATRVTAGVAILALAGSFALVASPTGDRVVQPGAESPAIDAAAFGGFSGIVRCDQGLYGTTTSTEWGLIVIGEEYPTCSIEASDPRISGNQHSVHNYHVYDGTPTWGVRAFSAVIANEEGSWIETEGWGYQDPEDETMHYAGKYRGTDAYEGLSALLLLTQDSWGLHMDVEGVIFPGELPDAPEQPIGDTSAAD